MPERGRQHGDFLVESEKFEELDGRQETQEANHVGKHFIPVAHVLELYISVAICLFECLCRVQVVLKITAVLLNSKKDVFKI